MSSSNQAANKSNYLLQWDQLPLLTTVNSGWLSLKFIDCQEDRQAVSQDCPLLPERNLDRLSSELEEIAFGSRMLDVFPMDSEKELTQEDQSTSVHSEPSANIGVHQAAELPNSVSLGRKGGCNCKKTGCLKMYCQCFSSGRMCTSQCNCCNCCNHEQEIETVVKAKHAAKQRHKNAFYQPLEGGLLKRCNCKKTQCQKKYCQCFNVGQKCTELCKCQDCLNGTHSPDQHSERQLAERLIF